MIPAPALRVRVAPLTHLNRLTDETGLFEHALLTVPRREHGYCVDDAARGLAVICRALVHSALTSRLTQVYLDFTLAALTADGRCHNRMTAGGGWQDEPGQGDWWGRAVWGLGVAAVHAHDQELRLRALDGFQVAMVARSASGRAMSFAALGAGEVLLCDPGHGGARALLADAVQTIGVPGADPAWPWPEPRLRYANGAVAEALLLAGIALPAKQPRDDGLLLLDFLLRTESRRGHLSVTPVAGRGPSDPRPAFDQQPIEVAALADACARAYAATGDPRWREGVRAAWAWFCGDNDVGIAMFDPRTGGGYDGLETGGRNLNQGAESTLAVLSTGQQAHRLGVLG